MLRPTTSKLLSKTLATLRKMYLVILYLFVTSFLVGITFAYAEEDMRGARNLEERDARIEERHEVLRSERAQKDDEIVVKFAGARTFERVRVGEGRTVDEALTEYRGRGDIEYAEPNYIAYAFSVPNDPQYPFQWHLDNAGTGGIGYEEAREISNGSGVIVAVIDTGVAYENYNNFLKTYYKAPDLANTSFAQGYDFVSNDSHANDENGHGTHVAGTIAQSTNNALGVAGIAPGASIMPIRVLDANGSGTYADVADGIRFAADNGAKVINLSLGGSTGATYLEEALAYAYGKGVTIVAASGNNGSGSVSYPAAYDNYVIAVGATRYDETRASYSNFGSALDIVAPGGDTSVDQNGDGYGDGVLQQTFSGALNNFGYYYFNGTSMATPHVAGVAALVISKGTATTPSDVREALLSTADDLGSIGRDNTYGYGIVDAFGAVTWGAPLPPTPPPATTTPTTTPPVTPATLFEDSFETNLSNWTQDSQNDWFRSNQRAKSGSYSAEIDGSATDAQLISNIINITGGGTTTVSFSWFIENSLDSGEYIAFDVSSNGGGWVELARLRGNQDTENAWHNREFIIAPATTLKIRFRGRISTSSEDADVDAILVKTL